MFQPLSFLEKFGRMSASNLSLPYPPDYSNQSYLSFVSGKELNSRFDLVKGESISHLNIRFLCKMAIVQNDMV